MSACESNSESSSTGRSLVKVTLLLSILLFSSYLLAHPYLRHETIYFRMDYQLARAGCDSFISGEILLEAIHYRPMQETRCMIHRLRLVDFERKFSPSVFHPMKPKIIGIRKLHYLKRDFLIYSLDYYTVLFTRDGRLESIASKGGGTGELYCGF